MKYALLAVAAFAAGAVNSVAGGGSLLTFPALLAAGLPPLAANATSTVSLVPGSLGAVWGYRANLEGARGVAVAMVVPSLAGGCLGALLALRTGDARFARMVPWLVAGATLLFAVQGPLAARLATTERRGAMPLVALGCGQLLVALYGGFFGAGIGILMLAALGFAGVKDIHSRNAMKSVAAAVINGVAAVTFVIGGTVRWTEAAVMALGALAGGTLGARGARKLGQKTVRTLVLVIGVGLAAWMFAGQLRGS